MPELPEVETIRRGLEDNIVGLKVTNIEVLNPKSFQGDSKGVLGKKITNVFRRAKVLGISFEKDINLLFHLKMSGQVILVCSSQLLVNGKKTINHEQISNNRFVGGHPTKDMLGELPNKSTRVIFTLNNDSKIYFNDQRKFGWVKVLKSSELDNLKLLKTLGPEPLEKTFSWELLKQRLLKRKNTAIKVVLLDQEIVSGIGNIYASEACFLSQINPNKKVSELSDGDFHKLHKAIVQTLSDGIKYGGSTKTHFVNADGKKGLFLDYAFVYSREGSPCKVCKTILTKIRLGGRGTVFCSKCQI